MQNLQARARLSLNSGELNGVRSKKQIIGGHDFLHRCAHQYFFLSPIPAVASVYEPNVTRTPALIVFWTSASVSVCFARAHKSSSEASPSRLA